MCESASHAIASHPVFIVGAPRSGTTWVQRLLLSDPTLCGGQETHFFNVMGSVVRSYSLHQKLGRNVGLPSYWEEQVLFSEIRALWEKTVAPLIERSAVARILVEKTPDHAMVLPEILKLFPRAKVIHVVRDSRSVAASLLAASQSWGAEWAPRTAGDAARLWHRYVRHAVAAGRGMPADQYLLVRYEDLMLDGIGQTRRLFGFLGIEHSEHALAQMVEAHSFSKQKNAESPIPVVRGDSAEPAGFFRSGKIDAWRHDLTLWQKLVVWRFTRKLMYEIGYTWRGRSIANTAEKPCLSESNGSQKR